MLREIAAYATYQQTRKMLEAEITAKPERKDTTIAEYVRMLAAMCRDNPDLSGIITQNAAEKNTDAIDSNYIGFEMYEVRVSEGNIEFTDQVDSDEMLDITLAMLHTKLDMRYGGTSGVQSFGANRRYFRQEFAEAASAKYISNMQMKRAEMLVNRRSNEPAREQSGEIFIGTHGNNPSRNYAAALTTERETARERKEQESRKILENLTF
jgi:hypothetical protein